MPALKTHCRQMHLRLGIQETIYLLFHYASLHSGKDECTILEFPAPKKLTTEMRCGISRQFRISGKNIQRYEIRQSSLSKHR